MLYKTTLTKELFYTSLSTILVLAGVVIAQRAVYVFRLAAKGIIPNDTIDTILVFNLLKHLPLLLSLTLFLTILMTLSRWYKDSEMIIWFSSGLGLYSLIKPIIAFCVPTIILIGYLSFFVSPWAVQKVEEYKNGIKTRDEFSTISPGVFKEAKSKNRIFYVEGFSELGNIVKNVFVQSEQNGKLGIIVSNQGKRITNEKNETYIVMEDGKRYEGESDTQEFSTTDYEKYSILLEKEIPSLSNVGAQAGVIEASSTFILLGKNPGGYYKDRYPAELSWRMSLPLSALCLLLIAIPLSFNNPRAGRSANIIIAVLIFVVYNNLIGILNSLIAVGKLNFWVGALAPHIIFGSIGIYLTYRRSRNLPLLPKRPFK